MMARLRREGADKPAPEESYGLFRNKGDMIYLVGETGSKEVNLDKDYKIQKVMLSAMRKNLVSCVQEVSDGGIFEALLRAAMPAGLGFDITTDSEIPEEQGDGKGSGKQEQAQLPRLRAATSMTA